MSLLTAQGAERQKFVGIRARVASIFCFFPAGIFVPNALRERVIGPGPRMDRWV